MTIAHYRPALALRASRLDEYPELLRTYDPVIRFLLEEKRVRVRINVDSLQAEAFLIA